MATLGAVTRLTTSIRTLSGLTFLAQRFASTDTLSPRRSLLYIPGNDERKIKKATTLKANTIVLDCEDGVAFNRKEVAKPFNTYISLVPKAYVLPHRLVEGAEGRGGSFVVALRNRKEARNVISNALNSINFGSCEVSVRINSIDGSELASDDLKAFLHGPTIPSTLLVPKVERVSHLEWINEKLFAVAKSVKSNLRMSLIIYVESALGLLNLREILESGVDETNMFNLEAVVFGSDDFFADIGATRTDDGKELLFARQSIVIHCKAYGLQAIDMVHINYTDLTALEREAVEGAKIGFTGKQVIHPNQVDIVNKAFSPSPEKVEWAKELVAAFEEQQKEGIGAITFRGQMIDMPLVKQAFNVIKLAKTMEQS